MAAPDKRNAESERTWHWVNPAWPCGDTCEGLGETFSTRCPLMCRKTQRSGPGMGASGDPGQRVALTLDIATLPVGTTRSHSSAGKVPTKAPRDPIGDRNPRRPASWRTQMGEASSASSTRVRYPSQCHLATRDSSRPPSAGARRQARVSPAAPSYVGLKTLVSTPVDNYRP